MMRRTLAAVYRVWDVVAKPPTLPAELVTTQGRQLMFQGRGCVRAQGSDLMMISRSDALIQFRYCSTTSPFSLSKDASLQKLKDAFNEIDPNQWESFTSKFKRWDKSLRNKSEQSIETFLRDEGFTGSVGASMSAALVEYFRDTEATNKMLKLMHTLKPPAKVEGTRLVAEYYSRETALEVAETYLSNSIRGCRGHDNKFDLLGCSGVKGIGKTEFLRQVAAQLAPKVGKEAKCTIESIYLTFSGGGTNTTQFMDLLFRNPSSHASAFGTLLFRMFGGPRETVVRFEEAIIAIRKCLKLNENDVLLILVDEIGDLGDAMASETIKALMSEMDAHNGKIVFIFVHIVPEVLNKGAAGSGRVVQPLPLSLLDINIWQTNPEWKAAAEKNPQLLQLFLSLCGHPRSIIESFPEALEANPSLLKPSDTPMRLVDARNTILTRSKLNDTTDKYISNVIQQWFSFESVDNAQLHRDGLLITLDAKDPSDNVKVLFPLRLQQWADINSNQSVLAYHLNKAYKSDAVVGKDTEKSMEHVMYHFEAIVRLSIGEGKNFTLGAYFKSQHMPIKWKNCVVTVKVPRALSIVNKVESFGEDFSDVIDFLQKGYIVVSEAHSEVGVEYLAPFFKEDGSLLVVCVQCKFVTEHTSWSDIKDKMFSATALLREREIDFVPVVFTTVNQRTVAEQTFADGVYFTEIDLFNFTNRLGILRLHREKLGSRLVDRFPFLRGE